MLKTQTKPASAARGKAAKSKAPRVPGVNALRKRSKAKENKRKLIMRAALDLFSLSGVHGTSVEQVAAHAKVSKTNLLYYFPSKERLYLDVLQQLLDVWLKPLQGFSVEQDPMATIAEYIRLKLEMSRDHPAESRLFCMEILQGAPLLLTHLSSPMRELVDSKAQVIRAWMDAGKIATMDPYHLIFMIWASTQHYADFRVQIEAVTGKNLQDPAFFASVLDNVQRLILGGLRPEPLASPD